MRDTKMNNTIIYEKNTSVEYTSYIVGNYYFDLTSPCCPEQYDVFNISDGKQVAYVKLRRGYLRADHPSCGDDTFYECDFPDWWKGKFDSEEERKKFLIDIVIALEKYLKTKETTYIDLDDNHNGS